MIDRTTLWIIIIGLGLGSYFLRFGFLGLVGNRPIPEWLLRHLRYTAVAILPALAIPQVVWPSGTGGEPDPARLLAACVTIIVGLWTKNVLAAISCGAVALYTGLFLLG